MNSETSAELLDELQQAWLHIREDFRRAMARRDKLKNGDVGFFELMRSRSLNSLVFQAEQEVDRLHRMLKAIDRTRDILRQEQAKYSAAPETSTQSASPQEELK